MGGTVIWLAVTFGCGLLFFFIGVYAGRREQPMWFWAGTEVDGSKLTDVKAYNRENARMWMLYSLWYWIAGIAWLWSSAVALIALILGCTLGIAVLVGTFLRIEKKYTRK